MRAHKQQETRNHSTVCKLAKITKNKTVNTFLSNIYTYTCNTPHTHTHLTVNNESIKSLNFTPKVADNIIYDYLYTFYLPTEGGGGPGGGGGAIELGGGGPGGGGGAGADVAIASLYTVASNNYNDT